MGKLLRALGRHRCAVQAVYEGPIAGWLLRLHELSELNHGWDGADAQPPNAVAVSLAECYVHMAYSRGLEITSMAPHRDGGIVIGVADCEPLIVSNDQPQSAMLRPGSCP